MSWAWSTSTATASRASRSPTTTCSPAPRGRWCSRRIHRQEHHPAGDPRSGAGGAGRGSAHDAGSLAAVHRLRGVRGDGGTHGRGRVLDRRPPCRDGRGAGDGGQSSVRSGDAQRARRRPVLELRRTGHVRAGIDPEADHVRRCPRHRGDHAVDGDRRRRRSTRDDAGGVQGRRRRHLRLLLGLHQPRHRRHDRVGTSSPSRPTSARSASRRCCRGERCSITSSRFGYGAPTGLDYTGEAADS
jgi:hypothetical protein